MGQYFKAINIDKKIEIMHDFNLIGGMKLCEHSYLRNPLALYIREMIATQWKGDRILHIGDYAQPGDGSTTSALLDSYLANGLWQEWEVKTEDGDTYTEKGIKPETEVKIPAVYGVENPKEPLGAYRYVVNLDKKIYYDNEKLIPCRASIEASESGKTAELWFSNFDPLLLLIACGNDQGGGDYHSGYQDSEKIGSWAGDRLMATNDKKEIEEYEEAIYYFTETPSIDKVDETLLLSKIIQDVDLWQKTKKERCGYTHLDSLPYGAKIKLKNVPKTLAPLTVSILKLNGYTNIGRV